MSGDVVASIRWDDPRSMVVFQCAPVLSGIKVSNLLIIDRDKMNTVYLMLRGTGLKCLTMAEVGDRVTVLIYDVLKLAELLSGKGVRRFLKKLGYERMEVETVLKRLACRYRKYTKKAGEFPHELGIVLGYPLADVYGFIINHGEHFLLNGYWKVYRDADKAKSIFRLYDECTERMMKELIG